MVKRVVYLLMALLLLAGALGEIDVVFDRVISHSTSISLNGTTFEVQIGEVNNTPVRLVNEFETIQLEEGDCIDRGYDEFCYESWEDEQRINANLTDARPIIEIDRNVGTRSLDLGETTTVELIFENTGGAIVNDFYFSETVPFGLSIINASGCTIDSNDPQRIEWDDDLFVDDEETCSYVVQASQVGTFTYSGSYSTDKLVSSTDADAVPQITFTNANPIELNISISQANLEVGQPFVVTVSIKNIESDNGDNLTIQNISIEYDEKFLLLQAYNSPFDSISTPDLVRFFGKIEPQELVSQRIELQPLVTDPNLTLEVEIAYRLGDEDSVSYIRAIPLNQSFIPLECEYIVVDDAGNNLISLQKLNNTLPGFDRGELFVYVYNRNNYVDIESMRTTVTGDLNFPSNPLITELRRNDDDILTSKLFVFDSLSALNIASKTEVNYKVLDGFFETTCLGNIFVQEADFFSMEKSLSFVNLSVDGNIRTVPRVQVDIQNNFFLPLRNIQIREVLPSQIFSNNNTQQTFNLAPLDTHTFTYDFLIPSDYVTLDDEEISVDSIISYKIYETNFSDTISLSFDINDVVSAQEGILLDALIETKVESLRQEINESFIASQPKVNESNSSAVPATTYSPFLNYFSIAIIIFLFLMGFIILNIKYSIVGNFIKWRAKQQAKNKAKKEADFAKKFQSYLESEEEIEKKIAKGKVAIKSLKKNYEKEERKFRKNASSLQLKKSFSQRKLESKQKEIARIQAQKKKLEADIALMNRTLVGYQNEVESIEVKKSQEKSLLDAKKKELDDQKAEVAKLQSHKEMLEASVEKMKSSAESKKS